MILSDSQVSTFWRLWSQACRSRGWTRQAGLSTADIDAKRKELLARCGFTSLTEVDRTAGFTLLKNELIVLCGESVQAARETLDPDLNRARVLRHVIRTEVLPCLALYEESPLGYLQTVISGLSRWYNTDRPERPPTLDDLTASPTHARQGRNDAFRECPSQLDQVLMTLSARVDAKRREAGHSKHEMKTRAGVKCDCARCRQPAPVVAVPEPEPAVHECPF